MRKIQPKLEWCIRIAFLLLPLILPFLPADFFDYGPPLCPSRVLLDTECPGCGLTRATQHLIHFEWETALDYNPLVVVTTPFLIWLWIGNLRTLHSHWKARLHAHAS